MKKLIWTLPLIFVISACSASNPSKTALIGTSSDTAKIVAEYSDNVQSFALTSIPDSIPKSTPYATPTSTPDDATETDVTHTIPLIEDYFYGYADETGSYIKLLDNHPNNESEYHLKFEAALGDNGIVYPVSFDRYQERAEDDSGRDTALNFNNQRGCVYKVDGKKAEYNNTYILLTEDNLSDLKVHAPLPSFTDKIVLSASIRYKIENIAKRKIKEAWVFSKYESGISLYLAVFEARGNDLLAWLVLDDGDSLRYYEYPASLDGYSGWAYDDGGEIYAEFIDPLCAITQNDSIIIFFTWWSEEIYYTEAVEFKDDGDTVCELVAGRYIAPY